MNIKGDEDLPRVVVDLLVRNGYAAKGVLDQGMGGWKDNALWQAIQGEGLFLLTADKGFADIRKYPPGSHFGVMLLRPDQDGIRPFLHLLESTLKAYDLGLFAGTITVVTPRGLRVRRTP